MSDLIALKRLTVSDLGWFRSIFHRRGLAGKQKAVNLNVAIFEAMFSALPAQRETYMAAKERMRDARRIKNREGFEEAQATAYANSHIPVLTTIYGPEGKPPLPLGRTIAFQDKNIRLGGRFVEDPPDDPDRFDPILQDGDLALLGFGGKELPTTADVVLVAAASPIDAPLYAALTPLVGDGRNSMVRLRPSRLVGIANNLSLPPRHPLWALASDPDLVLALEAAMADGVSEMRRVWKQRTGRKMSVVDLSRNLARVGRIGTDGELMVDRWLEGNLGRLGAASKVWMMADDAATHPFDFRLLDVEGKDIARLEVKSTSGDWKTEYYMSRNELAAAAESKIPYRIARLSEVGPTGAWLRISDDISPKAAAIIAEHPDDKPPGSRVASVLMSPTKMKVKWVTRDRLPPLVPPKVIAEGAPDPGDGEDEV